MVHKQVYYIKNSDPGFNMKNILRVQYPFEKNRNKMAVFRERLLQNPHIHEVSYGHYVPSFNFGNSYHGPSFVFDGKEVRVVNRGVYPQYFDLLDIPIVEGRRFRDDVKGDRRNNKNAVTRVVINETAVKEFGLENPVGTLGNQGSEKIEIIGVVKDFHPNTVKAPIPPLAFYYGSLSYN